MNGQPLLSAIPASLAPDDETSRLAGLFDAHQSRLYRLARRLTQSPDEARDLVQEAFLRAARSLRSVPLGHIKEEAWLVRVLVNIRRDQWRSAAVRSRFETVHRGETSRGPDPERALIARNTVWQALDLLPPRRRAIVVMHELEGMTASAIASLLGIAAVTVRWHLAAGRRELTRAIRLQTGEISENAVGNSSRR